MRWGHWGKRVAALGVLGLGGFVFGWVPYFLGSRVTLHPFHYNDRENAGLTPASFQLPFESVSFRSPDGVALEGWWVPAPQPRGTVVLVHGLNRSRIEMVRKGPFLHGLGWNALLFDLRHHGASGGGATTFGYREREDVRAAAQLARQKSPGPVVLWGVSLGAASAVLAAAEDPTIAGVVSDSSYRSLRDTVHHHMSLARHWRWWLGIVPEWPVADEVVYWMGREGGFDPDAVDVRAAAGRLRGRPCLFVCNSGDRRIPKEVAFDLEAAVGPSAKVLVVPGDSHGGAYRDGRAAYERAVGEVLGAAAGGPSSATAEGSIRGSASGG